MTKPELAADDLDDGLDYEFDSTVADDVENTEEFVDDGKGGVSDEDQFETEELSKPETEGRKKRKTTDSKFKEKKRLKMEMDLEAKKKISAESSPEVITDYINQIVSQKNKKLSSLELSDLYISKTDVRSTAEFSEKRNLDNLPKFIDGKFNNMLPATKKDSKKKKEQKNQKNQNSDERKFIGIISMSAIRACDIHRATRDLSGSSLKLINKNKINVDLKLLTTTNARVLCCTPGRLQKVLESEDSPLKSEEIKILILDNSYLDQKGQNIWDIPETIKVIKSLTSAGSKVYLY
ncbi:protein Cms1p [[Candida] jaroonii]|uniref:Protein Cms1p n=1 Tax=[Candida] jaroonii TaxID=467808 RepID=A0ACA9Y8V9_9ASCO|nr:protein Cms1p [[Candida] jaroonii]